MELLNHSDSQDSGFNVATAESNREQVIHDSPARALYMDIQAMTQYSLAQIAKLCDIPLSTLQRVATGMTRAPLCSTFDKLFRTYLMLLVDNPATSQLN